MKTITSLLFMLLSVAIYCQDTVYVDYLNRQYSSIPPEFIATDTNTIKDDSTIINELLVGPSDSYLDTVGTNFNKYYVVYSVTELQGGTSGFLQIDTNSTQLSFTALGSVSGTFINDTISLVNGSDLSFVLSASTPTTALRIQGQIYHTTTYITVQHSLPAITTVYYDINTNSTVSKNFASQFTPIGIKNDTTYMFDTSMVNVWQNAPTYTVNIPTTYPSYYLQYRLEHITGAILWNIDTNSTYVVGTSNAYPSKYYFLSGPTPLLDSMTISSGSTVDFIRYGGSNSSRFQVYARVFHTVDTVFINSNITDIREYDSRSSISVYPNPTKDVLYIDGYTGRNFEVVDLNGRIVKRGIINRRIDVGELKKGYYFLRTPKGSRSFLKN